MFFPSRSWGCRRCHHGRKKHGRLFGLIDRLCSVIILVHTSNPHFTTLGVYLVSQFVPLCPHKCSCACEIPCLNGSKFPGLFFGGKHTMKIKENVFHGHMVSANQLEHVGIYPICSMYGISQSIFQQHGAYGNVCMYIYIYLYIHNRIYIYTYNYMHMYIKWKIKRWETKTTCPFEIPPETHAVDEHVGLGFREGHTPHT